MTKWRWDQGRLIYFRYDNLCRIAKCLAEIDGIDMRGDSLRAPLEAATGMPFSPKHYSVWRNYARVFGCALLATAVGNRLIVTGLCRKVAGVREPPLLADEYLSYLMPRFYYPSPVFQEYAGQGGEVFPFCAVLKMLLARYRASGDARLTLPEVFSLLIGNEVKGSEPLDRFARLRPTSRRAQGDELRQVREMLIFASQFSYLKWLDGVLYLDLEPGAAAVAADLEKLAAPIPDKPRASAVEALLEIGRGGTIMEIVTAAARDLDSDFIFTEGRRVRVTHLRIERSPSLRRLFMSRQRGAVLCDGCAMDAAKRYPWPNNIIEVHHLLPLASSVAIDGRGVGFGDLVPVCANCHKGVHSFYRQWLVRRRADDFTSREEAVEAYDAAKDNIRRHAV